MAEPSTPADGNSTLTYAAATVPVVQGALALIVITFVGQAWASIDPAKHSAAFELIYACGAHFISSFAIAAPVALLVARVRNDGIAAAFTVGLYSYTFWSLNVQHQGLASLLVEQGWRMPLPYGETIKAFSEWVLGGEAAAMYLAPLLVSYLVALLLAVPLGILLFPSRRK